jgi:hypothetical protein
MRALVMQAIVNDSTLNTLGVDEDSAFSGDVDTPQTRPFLQMRWGRNSVGLDVVTRRDVTIWVHDEPGDYGRIDSIILRLRQLLPELVGQSNGLGHLMAVEWINDSEDLADDGHGTIARTVSFLLIGTGQ